MNVELWMNEQSMDVKFSGRMDEGVRWPKYQEFPLDILIPWLTNYSVLELTV